MRTLIVASLTALLAVSAQAQTGPYPNRPIKLLVGFAPGGAADYVARSLGESLGRAMGQSIVVENRAGAGSSLAAEATAKSAPDGYTILIASPSSISVNPALKAKLGYTSKDLLPVTKVSSSPLVIAVNPGLGITSVVELVAKAKQSPGALNYATSGVGSAPHLGAALFSRVAGVQMTHIPFKGGAPAIHSLIAGDTQLTFGTPPSVLPMVKAGRLKALAVSSKERSPLFPDHAIEFWYGIFVPAGTPAPIVKKIFDATITAMQNPSVKAALAREGTDVAISASPEQFAAFLAEDGKFWTRLVTEAGVTAD